MPRVGGFYLGPHRALIVVFACGLIDQGRALGEESLRRLRRAADLYKDLRRANMMARVVVSAGYAPNRSTKFPHQELSMAELQCESLEDMGVHLAHIVVAGNPLTWGSRAELQTAVEYRNSERKHGYEEYPLYLVTSLVHSWRVRFLAIFQFGLKGSEVFVRAVRPSLIVAAIEFAKLPLQVVQVLAKKLYNKRPARP